MAKLSDAKRGTLSRTTRLIVDGRDSTTSEGFVNIPPFRGSTVCYPDAGAHLTGKAKYTYGRRGNPTMKALEDLWSSLEGAHGTVICPSGANAFSVALLSLLKAGDHLLMTDSVYFPVRHFCETVQKRFGIETTYYDPLIGAGIAALMRPEHGDGLYRKPRLADVRDPGYSGHRRGRTTGMARSSPSTTPADPCCSMLSRMVSMSPSMPARKTLPAIRMC